MGKTQFDPPTDTFPYKIKKRLNIMSVPRKQYIDKGEGMPAYTPRGIRQSAVRAHCSDRVNDAGWPYVRLLSERTAPTESTTRDAPTCGEYLHYIDTGEACQPTPPGASGSLLSKRTAPTESTTRDGPTCGEYLHYIDTGEACQPTPPVASGSLLSKRTAPTESTTRDGPTCGEYLHYIDTGEGMPAYTPRGIRQSAVRAHCSDRVNDAGMPYVRRFLLIKKMYKNQFSLDRMERIDRMMEVTNATCYSKLANCVLDLRKDDTKDTRKKKGWSESEWKKHMEATCNLSQRDKGMPLEMLLQRINQICFLPEFRVYKRYSQDILHKDPIKTSKRLNDLVVQWSGIDGPSTESRPRYLVVQWNRPPEHRVKTTLFSGPVEYIDRPSTESRPRYLVVQWNIIDRPSTESRPPRLAHLLASRQASQVILRWQNRDYHYTTTKFRRKRERDSSRRAAE
ncbi:Uncharacterized protein OBRU01_21565 [Operophtera brumata]|uniref:Uncharacterized protein n=1 Tax=Operophtera brumata TaxID=104452 RepID=A0A0L7KSG6_OPEBR|nr:Uncharacterized protein OBRU01_21565 [Operophtera brumata]